MNANLSFKNVLFFCFCCLNSRFFLCVCVCARAGGRDADTLSDPGFVCLHQFDGNQGPDPTQCCQFRFIPPHPPPLWRVHVLPCWTSCGPGDRRDTHRCHGGGMNVTQHCSGIFCIGLHNISEKTLWCNIHIAKTYNHLFSSFFSLTSCFPLHGMPEWCFLPV